MEPTRNICDYVCVDISTVVVILMLLTYKSKVSYVNVSGRHYYPNTMRTIVQMCETMFMVCAC